MIESLEKENDIEENDELRRFSLFFNNLFNFHSN